MAESNVIPIFGVHRLQAYNITTGDILGTARVVGSAEIKLEAELKALNGGSSKYPWAVERGLIGSEVTLSLKEYPSFLFQTLLGKTPSENAAETGGSCSTLTDKYGGSVVASTGIATATVKSGSETDLKFGKYLVKAVSSTTVDVYAYTDVDFANGTDLTYQNDLCKITASALTITTSTAVTIPSIGIELTGGAGTIGMTTGHTATFEVRPINTKSRSVVIGSTTETFTDFGLYISAARSGSGVMQVIDCFKCAGAGMPINLTENEFSEFSVTLQMYRDTARSEDGNGLFKFTEVQAV